MATEAQLKLAHRLAQTIAEFTGHETKEVMGFAKTRAIRRGYPIMVEGDIIVHEDGEPVGESLTKTTTEEAGHLIEELYQIAAEVGALYQE